MKTHRQPQLQEDITIVPQSEFHGLTGLAEPAPAPRKQDAATQAPKPASTGEHSPLPWKVMADPSYPAGLHPLHNHRFITTEAMGVEGDGELADFDGRGSLICALRDQECQAGDAAFIVRACNEYETVKSESETWKRQYGASLQVIDRLQARAQRLADDVEYWKTAFNQADVTRLEALSQAKQLAEAIKQTFRNDDEAFIREALAQWEGAQ